MLGLIALTPQGVEGSIYTMLSHGLTTGGLFLAIGVLYERRHTRRMAEFGGLWAQMPIFGALFLICVLGSAGLPGLSGFVGEFLSILGTFISGGSHFPEGWPSFIPAPKVLAAIAALGVILGAVYLLYMFEKVMFGPITNERNRDLPDVTWREIAVFLPVVALIFALGLFPRPFLKVTENTVDRFINDYKARLAEPDGPPHLRGQPPPGEGDQPDSPAAADQPAPAAAPAPSDAPAPSGSAGGARGADKVPARESEREGGQP
jgi:NADH-quinone oxidoreductase subunit M